MARKLKTKQNDVGVFVKTHGMEDTPEYRAWVGAIYRCENKKGPSWHRYGGRGLRVSGAWRDSFEAFFSDMGRKPTPAHSLERIDNNAGYSKENCRWATAKEQAHNRGTNVFYSAFGQSLTIGQWSEKTGISLDALKNRLRRGWPLCRALTRPMRNWREIAT